MFDDNAFDTQAFSTESWLFDLGDAAKRYIVRVSSTIVNQVTLLSRLW